MQRWAKAGKRRLWDLLDFGRGMICATYMGEMIFRELKGLEGVRIEGYSINHIRNTDDTVLAADSAEKFQPCWM